MENITKALFDTIRVSRTTYLLANIAMAVVFGLMLLAATTLIMVGEHMFAAKAVGWLASLVIITMYAYCSIVVSVNRLHDIGISGWWTLVQFAPYVNIVFGLFLLLMPPQDLVNEYGTFRV
jgi:uncharacterized membrane protein YhaH (DUF805 family)